MPQNLKPAATNILNELIRARGAWISGNVFLNNYCTSYSQRIGEIKEYAREHGIDWIIDSEREPGHAVNRYRLTRREEKAA